MSHLSVAEVPANAQVSPMPLVLCSQQVPAAFHSCIDHERDQAMLEHLRNRFDSWRIYRRTVYELSLLDRHILADLGLDHPSLKAIKARAKAATRAARL